MYDEVLALMPANGNEKVDRQQENMFSQVQYFYFMIVLKKDGPKAILSEAREWLKLFEKWQKADGYQGIALEVAKADVALLEKGGGDQRQQLKKEVDDILKMMKKIPSEYHKEGMELAREMNKKGGSAGPAKTWDEAVANGDDSFGAQKWDEAIQFYEQAIGMSKGMPAAGRKATLASIREKLETCHYNQVYHLFSEGKEEEAMALAASLIEEKKISAKSETAGKLAALRVHIILRRYASSQNAEEKEKLLAELTAAAADVVEKWPDKPAADDARIAMAQAAMVQGKTADAITQLEDVNPRSEKYPTALHMAALGHLRIWNVEKQKPPAERNAKLMKQESEKAVEDLEKSIEVQTKALGDGQSLPGQLIESELVLGQVYLEANEAQKTAQLLQPVVDSIKASKPEKLDGTMLKVFSTAVRAYVATGDMTKGGDVATVLTDLGDDVADINAVLVAFARMLFAEYKSASAALIEAKAENDSQAIATAEARLGGTKELLGKLPRAARPAQEQHAGQHDLDRRHGRRAGPDRAGQRDRQSHPDPRRRGRSLLRPVRPERADPRSVATGRSAAAKEAIRRGAQASRRPDRKSAQGPRAPDDQGPDSAGLGRARLGQVSRCRIALGQPTAEAVRGGEKTRLPGRPEGQLLRSELQRRPLPVARSDQDQRPGQGDRLPEGAQRHADQRAQARRPGNGRQVSRADQTGRRSRQEVAQGPATGQHGGQGQVTAALPPRRVELVLVDLGLPGTALRAGEWLVAAGAEVARGDRLLEIVAGSVTVDLPAPASGIFAQRLVETDAELRVGQVLAVIHVADA